jgi:uncharacterized repeat protein (TIGR01451 family)
MSIRKSIIFMTLIITVFIFIAHVAQVQASSRPNVVVIMTDDQDLESLRVMTKTLALIGAEGTTFSNFFASFPLCCPSRSTFITGQYSHNHGVESNKPPEGGYGKLDDSNTLPVWLQGAGYYTAHIGKWLNGYGVVNPDPTEVPSGWSDWQGLVDPSTYQMYGYTINDNGTLVTYGDTESDYQTDVLADRAVAVINERAGQAEPFFLSIGTLAPHGESALPGEPAPRSAPRHQGIYANEPLPKPPSFNEQDVSDKPSVVRNLPLFTPEIEQKITDFYRARIESLLAVDDLVERVVSALQSTGQLDNTVIFFTSDNGHLRGQHRIGFGKIWVYEESVRVPLLVRGGGFPAGVTANQFVANIDLAPTIVELTVATPGLVMDGRSLLPLALNPEVGRDRHLLLETGPVVIKSVGVNVRYKAVRTERYLWVEHGSGARELYDLENDPFQLTSRHTSSAYQSVKAQLQSSLGELRTCSGSSCSQGTAEPPEILLSTNFDVGTDGFTYSDDTFRGTSNPNYAKGNHLTTGGFSGGRVNVFLGGIDNVATSNMSGGWSRSFVVNQSGMVNITLKYNLQLTKGCESDECGQALVGVDGNLASDGPEDFLEEFCGATPNPPSDQNSGWREVSINLDLTAGTHTITLGGWKSKKSAANEFTNVLFDDVLVTQLVPLPSPTPTPSPEPTPTPTPQAMADLSVTNTDSADPISTGNNLIYTITITNNGSSTATGVTLTDTLPTGATFVSATPNQGSCNGTSTLTCALGTLTNSATATVTIVIVTPTAAGTISNTASVTGDQADPNGTNNADTENTTVNVTCDGFTPTILGTPGDDVITGTSGTDIIHGLAGNDDISGLGGNDRICGGMGNDTLRGNGGNDKLNGGPDTDTCDGGTHTNGDTARNCESIINVP